MLAGAATFAQQPPVIRVPVRLVTVPALVLSEDGRPVDGLQTSDFRLLDDGRPQQLNLDTEINPVSLAIVVQANREVRSYLPFIAKTGSLIDALLSGEGGETALITCNDDVHVAKRFDSGDLSRAMKDISADGRSSRMLDAAARAADLLRQRPASRSRILLLIGQPVDQGSETKLTDLRERIAEPNLTVYTLTLPVMGRAFVSDTFTLQGVSRAERGGFRAGADLKNLVTVLDRASAAAENTDPFSELTAATGGVQLRFRQQAELEGELAAMGLLMRSVYTLSYSPDSSDPGCHTLMVEVTKPGLKVYARPGYCLR
jgi:VWFA-related protein